MPLARAFWVPLIGRTVVAVEGRGAGWFAFGSPSFLTAHLALVPAFLSHPPGLVADMDMDMTTDGSTSDAVLSLAD